MTFNLSDVEDRIASPSGTPEWDQYVSDADALISEGEGLSTLVVAYPPEGDTMGFKPAEILEDVRRQFPNAGPFVDLLFFRDVTTFYHAAANALVAREFGRASTLVECLGQTLNTYYRGQPVITVSLSRCPDHNGCVQLKLSRCSLRISGYEGHEPEARRLAQKLLPSARLLSDDEDRESWKHGVRPYWSHTVAVNEPSSTDTESTD